MSVIFVIACFIGGWIYIFGSIPPLALAGFLFIGGLMLMADGVAGNNE